MTLSIAERQRRAAGAEFHRKIGEANLVASALSLLLLWWLSERVATFVYGVRAFDPLTLMAVPLVLLTVALLANWLPARRATQVEPVVALRSE